MAARKKTTAPEQEATTASEETAPMQEAHLDPGTPEPDAPSTEPFVPYEATVAVSMAAVRKGKNGKAIGTIGKGTKVTVTGSVDGFAILSNGTHVKEAYLERKE